MSIFRKSALFFAAVAVLHGSVANAAITYSADGGSNGIGVAISTTSYARAMSVGNGANVSASVPLIVNIPRRIAIAVDDGATFTSFGWFNAYTPSSHSTLEITDNGTTATSMTLTLGGGGGGGGGGSSHVYMGQPLNIYGAVYTNADNVRISKTNYSAGASIFTHANGASSGSFSAASLWQVTTNTGSTTLADNAQSNVSGLSLTNRGGVAPFLIEVRPIITHGSNVNPNYNLDATDRSGAYNATMVITAEVL